MISLFEFLPLKGNRVLGRGYWQPIVDEEGCGATIAAALEAQRCGADEYNLGVCYAEEHLIGTCDGHIPDEAYEAFLKGVDEIAFLCDCCGWWCEASERTEQDYCYDCDDEGD